MRNHGVPPSGSGLRPYGAEPAAQSQAKPLVPNAGQVYRSQGYEMFLDYSLDGRGDPTVEQWRFRLDEDEGSDGYGWLELRVHEIVETERSGTLAVYYRQWFAPDGEPAWGSRRKRVIGSIASLKALMRRRKMRPASGMSAGTAETPQEAQGQRPAIPVGEAETPKDGGNHA